MPPLPPVPAVVPSGFIGIEAGGTRTTAVWRPDDARGEGQTISLGPANLQLFSDSELLRLFREVAAAVPRPRAVGVGMAGARTETDRARIRTAVGVVWPSTPCHATHDLEIALAAAPPPVRSRTTFSARVLVLSGTGSCCFGQRPDGSHARAGGWGHWLGDQGSAHAIAHAALRELIVELDRSGRWGELGQSILAELRFNEPNALVPWITGASKSQVAALAPLVFAAAERRDAVARRVLAVAARDLADTALACAAKLTGPRLSVPVQFVLAGSVLLRQPGFARRVGQLIRRERPAARITALPLSGADGAIALARRLVPALPSSSPVPARPAPGPAPDPDPVPISRPEIPGTTQLSPTEQRNPRSMNLDRLPLREAIELMISEEERIPAALRTQAPSLERALRLVVSALRSGGRLFYVGAGTSGRLGILDASECPPTFRTPRELVQGIIAGGETAVFRSVEGAEDDFETGRLTMSFRGITSRDVVVGIAASGRTPFVWGALTGARALGARTVLIAFNPHLRFARGHQPDVVIAPDLGPEVLTGSTRLKSGTATKLVLNLLTTLAMVRLGKVVENLMVDLNPANAKLRDRAIRIARELTGASAEDARRELERAGWLVQPALKSLRQPRA